MIGSGAPPPRPDVASFDDYRALLAAFHDWKRAGRRGFSWRRFASLAGVKSPNYFQTILKGGKNLSEPLAEVAARLLGLEDPERDYFLALVREEHAPGERERADARRNRLRAHAELSIAKAGLAQKRLLEAWYHSVVREMSVLPGFEPDPTWIASRLRGLVSAAEAAESLALLQEAGLLERAAEGKLVPAQPALIVRDVDKRKAREFLTQNLSAWSRVFSDLDPSVSFGTVASFAIPEEKIPELVAMVRAFAKELAGVQMNAGTPSRVMQMGVFLVPVTKGPGEEGPA